MGTLKDGTVYVTGRTADNTKLHKILSSPNKAYVGKFVDSDNLNKWSLGGTPTFYGNSLAMDSWHQTTASPTTTPPPTSSGGGYSVQSTNGGTTSSVGAGELGTLQSKVDQLKAQVAANSITTMGRQAYDALITQMGDAEYELNKYKQAHGIPLSGNQMGPVAPTGVDWDSHIDAVVSSFNPASNPAPNGNVTTTMTPAQMQQNQNNGNPSANLPAAPSATPNQEQIANTDPYPFQGYDPGLNGVSGSGGTPVPPTTPPATTPPTGAGGSGGIPGGEGTGGAGGPAVTANDLLGIPGMTPELAAILASGGAGALATYLAAKTQGDAATQAAQTQANAQTQAGELQKQIFDQIRTDQTPWRDAGTAALGKLNTFFTDNPDFGMSQFQQDPGYSFRLSEGMKALQNSAAARGTLLSGNTLKGIQNYGQEAASQEYNNAFNRYQTQRGQKLNHLQSLAGVGQSAVNQVGAAGQNYANNAGSAIIGGANATAGGITGAGSANASGWVGGANALNNALSTYLNYNQSQGYLNALRNGG